MARTTHGEQVGFIQDGSSATAREHLVNVDASLPDVGDLRIVRSEDGARLTPRPFFKEPSDERTPNLVVRFAFR
jgi:hypothetical protein